MTLCQIRSSPSNVPIHGKIISIPSLLLYLLPTSLLENTACPCPNFPMEMNSVINQHYSVTIPTSSSGCSVKCLIIICHVLPLKKKNHSSHTVGKEDHPRKINTNNKDIIKQMIQLVICFKKTSSL